MGERMTWAEMVEKYPDKWVALKDVEWDGADVGSAVLVAALSNDEFIDFEVAHLNEDYDYVRTTEGNFGGLITVENARIYLE